MKRIIFTVTNDLTYDQRMRRICTSLAEAGYQVTLVGRQRSNSVPLNERPYEQVRLRNLINQGKFFYLEYNLRLFLLLLFRKVDIICSIDLDTILAGSWASAWKRKPLVYDAHEYFPEMQEVVTRPGVKKMWERIERKSIPKLSAAYTISNGYADMFMKKYAKKFEVVRNVPVLEKLPEGQKSARYVLYQGAVNVGRGLEELVRSMPQIDVNLHIIGNGDVFDELNRLAEDLSLENKVIFKGLILPEELLQYTQEATVGVTLFSSTGLHHRHSLANRFFDYIHAGVPQVAMNYPEYRDFNERYEVAMLIDDLKEATIAGAINELMTDKNLYDRLKSNCMEARQQVNWQREEKKLLALYGRL